MTPESRPSPSSKTRRDLLDAAERLFADFGVDRASLRSITRDAGANLAAVHYHFGSKEGLVRAVLNRRLAPLNQRRLELLGEAERRHGGAPPVEEIVTSFVLPALEMVQKERGGHAFARFLGRTFSEPNEAIRSVILQEFGEIIERFTAALARALPELPPAEVYWRFHFMVGSMAHTVGLGFLAHRFSGGLCNPLDIDSVNRNLIQFVTGGMAMPPSKKATA
jgi:AcrR family transcriptional regulator